MSTAFLGRTLRPALFGLSDSGLVHVRLQRNSFGCRDSGRTKGAADGTAAPDSGCNLFSKLLTIRSILSVPSFGRVSEKTTLDEHGRYACLSQDVVATATHAAVKCTATPDNVMMNRR